MNIIVHKHGYTMMVHLNIPFDDHITIIFRVIMQNAQICKPDVIPGVDNVMKTWAPYFFFFMLM